jgi:hypothetical protein
LVAGHVPEAVKLGNLAKSLRAMPLQPGWLWSRVEAGRQVCPDLAQMVKVKQLLLAISPVLPLRPVVTRDRACLLDLATLPAQPRQATLDSPRPLVMGRRARVLQLPLAEERSSGFQS